jgi:hypothetical protein
MISPFSNSLILDFSVSIAKSAKSGRLNVFAITANG